MTNKTTNTKKNPAMRNSKPSTAKTEKYIYTEEDLGEGLLDAGVTYNYDMAASDNSNMNEGLNVQEDFSQAYFL